MFSSKFSCNSLEELRGSFGISSSVCEFSAQISRSNEMKNKLSIGGCLRKMDLDWCRFFLFSWKLVNGKNITCNTKIVFKLGNTLRECNPCILIDGHFWRFICTDIMCFSSNFMDDCGSIIWEILSMAFRNLLSFSSCKDMKMEPCTFLCRFRNSVCWEIWLSLHEIYLNIEKSFFYGSNIQD